MMIISNKNNKDLIYKICQKENASVEIIDFEDIIFMDKVVINNQSSDLTSTICLPSFSFFRPSISTTKISHKEYEDHNTNVSVDLAGVNINSINIYHNQIKPYEDFTSYLTNDYIKILLQLTNTFQLKMLYHNDFKIDNFSGIVENKEANFINDNIYSLINQINEELKKVRQSKNAIENEFNAYQLIISLQVALIEQLEYLLPNVIQEPVVEEINKKLIRKREYNER